MDNFCQSPVTTNIQGNIANFPNERRISSDIMRETIKGFKGLTIDSIINNSAYYHSEEDEAEGDPNSDPKVATHTSERRKRKFTDTETTNVNSLHKLLINRLITEIIPFATSPIDKKTADDAAGSGETLHARCTILSKEIVMDAARRAAHFYGLLQW